MNLNIETLSMQIAIVQSNYHIGHFEGNFQKITAAIDTALQQGADLVVFPEMAVTGYPPRDFLEFEDFIARSIATVHRIADYAADKDIGVVVGAPAHNPQPEGKNLFNTAYLLYQGQIISEHHKALLPTYDIFDEYRYFEPGTFFKVVQFKGVRLAITICEDLWNVGNENPLYTINPMDQLMDQQPEVILNIAASPFDHSHAVERLEVLKANVARYRIPLLYVNHVGAQTELIFDGGSLVLNDAGFVVEELPYFEEVVRTYSIEDLTQQQKPLVKDHIQSWEKPALLYRALTVGIQNYFQKLGFTDAILGLSGGIDSALVLVLASEALGSEHVHPVLLPSSFSSGHSVTDAEALAQGLGTPYSTLPIATAYDTMLETLAPHFGDASFGLAEENLQARIRANYLMALSNKKGYILLNTSNKSEAAVGYSTLYGDMCGGLSVIGDVYKTEVYEIARWINREREIIPEYIITKPPSAELRPDQKDTDSLPPYDVLDPLLFQYIEERKGPQELIAAGFDKALVDKVLKLVNTTEYKRHQTPPILRVSPKAFGMGRRMPIVAKYLSE